MNSTVLSLRRVNDVSALHRFRSRGALFAEERKKTFNTFLHEESEEKRQGLHRLPETHNISKNDSHRPIHMAHQLIHEYHLQKQASIERGEITMRSICDQNEIKM